MHILSVPEINEPIPVYQGRQLESGKAYLCANRFIGQMFNSEWRCMVKDEMWPARMLLMASPWPNTPFDPHRGQTWIYRGGGYGDILMLTPVLKALRDKYPDMKIHLACGDTMHELFNGLNFLKVNIEQVPIPLDKLFTDCNIVSLEDLVEGDPAAEKVHMAQLFADKFGIKLQDKKPLYRRSTDELAWSFKFYPRKFQVKRIGIQFLASALYRSYPQMGQVVKELSKDYEVYLFGQPGQLVLKNPVDNVVNLMEEGLNFRQSAAVLSTCDVCIAPDSSLVHLCSALDIPCVALYGPFPAALRVSTDKVTVLEGHAPCSPCFFHAQSATDFPAGMPCFEPGRCIAMESIKVEQIVRAVKELL